MSDLNELARLAREQQKAAASRPAPPAAGPPLSYAPPPPSFGPPPHLPPMHPWDALKLGFFAAFGAMFATFVCWMVFWFFVVFAFGLSFASCGRAARP